LIIHSLYEYFRFAIFFLDILKIFYFIYIYFLAYFGMELAARNYYRIAMIAGSRLFRSRDDYSLGMIIDQEPALDRNDYRSGIIIDQESLFL